MRLIYFLIIILLSSSGLALELNRHIHKEYHLKALNLLNEITYEYEMIIEPALRKARLKKLHETSSILRKEIKNIKKDTLYLFNQNSSAYLVVKEKLPTLSDKRDKLTAEFINRLTMLNKSLLKEVKKINDLEEVIKQDQLFLLRPLPITSRLNDYEGRYLLKWYNNESGDFIQNENDYDVICELYIKNDKAKTNWGIRPDYLTEELDCHFLNDEDPDFYVEIPILDDARTERFYYYFKNKNTISAKRYWSYPNEAESRWGIGKKAGLKDKDF
jgi:hypothetical protein